jgi:hypothetical protein
MAEVHQSPAATAGAPKRQARRGVAPLTWLLGAAALSLGLWALIVRGLAALF